MTMSDEYSIKVENVAKMYKMYKSNFAKISDLLGLPFKKDYDEFWPLKDIDFTVKKGEKVGIIGRNGAGKTTLLSMIADNIKPTTGKISVVGQVNALFVLGTGFHPEFSGRENIYSSLAFQGIVGNEAKRLEKEIVEFAELEQFIDQPVKTYSAGMYARLAFTVATAIEPEILIIDEILGAGDAYFASKAVERMKELTSGGSTVLFVSHDLASVQQMCERCIWIDKGKIREDGATLDVIKAYSADVRKREELRLLKKNTQTKTDESVILEDRELIFRFIGENGKAPNIGLPIHKVSLFINEELFLEILVGDSMDNNSQEEAFVITAKKIINWDEPKKIDGKWTREFKNVGGRNIHAAGMFKLPMDESIENIDFEIEYFDMSNEVINFEIFLEDEARYQTFLKIEPKGSNKLLKIDTFGNSGVQDISKKELLLESEIENTNNHEIDDIYGTGEVEITKFEILNSNLEESYVYTINKELRFRIYYKTSKTVILPVFAISIYSEDGRVVSQLISKEKNVSFNKLYENGFVDFIIPSLKIGAGKYILSIAIFHDIDLVNPIEQKSYVIHDRKYEFKIEQPLEINMNLGLVYQDCEIVHNLVNNDI